MNVKLLRKVKRHILAEPKRLVMSAIDLHGTPGQSNGIKGLLPKYGTAACICGWSCFLGGLEWDRAYYENAAKLLGIRYKQAERLFEPSYWPEQFADGLKDDGKPKTAKVAAARIEHFIKTKGAE